MELNLGGRTSATAYDVCQEILSLSALLKGKEGKHRGEDWKAVNLTMQSFPRKLKRKGGLLALSSFEENMNGGRR